MRGKEQRSGEGYLYCVYSKRGNQNKYFREFLKSYRSLKRVIPNAEVALYTNVEFEDTYDIDWVIYDENIDQRLICKAHGILHSPFKKTIFLDTDTMVHRPVLGDIFQILDEFRFCCCYGNWSNAGSIIPDLNTGLLGVTDSSFSRKLIRKWITYYDKIGNRNDQKALRRVFVQHKRQFHILPPYFNYRCAMIKGYPKQAVISHDHSMNKNRVTRKIISHYKSSLR